MIKHMQPAIASLLQQLAAFCAARSSSQSPEPLAAWLVGGAMRDLALHRTPHDLDLAVNVDGLELARDLANRLGGSFVALDAERSTGRVVYTPPADDAATPPQPFTIDIARLRDEAATIEGDLWLRDFTINALALPLPEAAHTPPADWRIIDPCGGLDDLTHRLMRPCLPSSLQADPVRMLRALRLGASLDMQLVPDLERLLRRDAPLIQQPAAERVRDELFKLLSLPTSAAWLIRMDNLDVLTRLFPELEACRGFQQPIVHFLPVLEHSLETVVALEWLLAGLSDPNDPNGPNDPNDPPPSPMRLPAAVQAYPDLPRSLRHRATLHAHFARMCHAQQGYTRAALLKLAALLHDVAKPQTFQPKADGGASFYGHQLAGAAIAGQIARRLCLSRSTSRYVSIVVREHMRPGQLRDEPNVTPRAFARFFRDTEKAGPDVLLHALADHMAVRGPLISPPDWAYHLEWTNRLLDRYLQPADERISPLVNGYDVMQTLGMRPGRHLGELLHELHAAQAAGEITTREEALDMARQMLRQQPDEGDEANT